MHINHPENIPMWVLLGRRLLILVTFKDKCEAGMESLYLSQRFDPSNKTYNDYGQLQLTKWLISIIGNTLDRKCLLVLPDCYKLSH